MAKQGGLRGERKLSRVKIKKYFRLRQAGFLPRNDIEKEARIDRCITFVHTRH